MVVYIEYALAENFLIDGALLWLALVASKSEIRATKLFLGALSGAVFAVVCPLFALPKVVDYALKIAFAPCMCRLAYGKLKPKPRAKNFWVMTVVFFLLSFAFAGLLFAFCAQITPKGESYELARMPVVCTLCAGFVFTLGIPLLALGFYKKRALQRLLYDCVIENNGKNIKVKGFYDSGNSAEKNGLPVCFVSPDICYDLWGENTQEKIENLAVATVSGVKTVRLYLGTLYVENKRMKAYFAPAVNMISREYKLLLNAHSLTSV